MWTNPLDVIKVAASPPMRTKPLDANEAVAFANNAAKPYDADEVGREVADMSNNGGCELSHSSGEGNTYWMRACSKI